MPEATTDQVAIAILIRNTQELYMQVEVTNPEIAAQDISAIKLLSAEGEFAVFKVGDRYYIGEPA